MVSFSKRDGKRGNNSTFEEIRGLKNKRMQIMSLTLALVPQGDLPSLSLDSFHTMQSLIS